METERESVEPGRAAAGATTDSPAAAHEPAAGEPTSNARQRRRNDLGPRLRAAREAKRLTLRELAQRVGVSASLISQIETGKCEPSISTLFGIVGELGLPVNEIVFGSADDDAPATQAPMATGGENAAPPRAVSTRADATASPVQPAHNRATIHIERGVTWERLTAHPDHEVDFLLLRYEPGGESTPAHSLMRHNGREYGYVLKGRLSVTIGFDTYEVGPGESISFDCTVPHRLATIGDEPVEAVWFVVGRRRTMVESGPQPTV